MKVKVVLATLAILQGCATAPRTELDDARQQWLEEAVRIAEPHVERAIGWEIRGLKVKYHNHSPGYCGYAARQPLVEFYKCERGFYNKDHAANATSMMFVVLHELAHVAEWQRYGNPGSGGTHGWRWRKVYGTIRSKVSPFRLAASLPPYPSPDRHLPDRSFNHRIEAGRSREQL